MSATKAIYGGLRALGLSEEEDRRDLYERVTAKRRLREMTPAEKSAVVEELRRLGFRGRDGSSGRVGGRAGRLDGPYAKKLQALWIAGWNLGLMRSNTDAALMAFVKRQTGVDHTRFLREQAEANRAIEALKGWLARDGGVDWSPRRGDEKALREPGGRVALAQFRIMGRREIPCAPTLLDEVRAQGLDWPPTRTGWIKVMNAMGARIRAFNAGTGW